MYALALLFFFLDILMFSLFEKQILYLLLCFYILNICDKRSLITFIIFAFLIALESSLYYSKFGVQLLYLIPITLIAFKVQKTFWSWKFQASLILITCLLIQSYFIEPFLLGIPATFSYTNSKIIANIIVLWCMSLIFSSQGKLGNRSKAL
jgi:hypothetical protein